MQNESLQPLSVTSETPEFAAVCLLLKKSINRFQNYMDSSRGNFARVDALANGDFDVNVWGEENGDLEMLFRNPKVYNRSPFPEGKKSN